MDAALHGAVAGGAATLPMSMVMLTAGRLGWMGEQPPKTIFESFLAAAGIPIPDERTEETLVAAAHLGYGMLAGTVFALLREHTRMPLPPVAQGIGYGLLIWALSYEGWIPALHIMRPPEHDRPGRPQAMILAHAVYGAVLGSLAQRL